MGHPLARPCILKLEPKAKELLPQHFRRTHELRSLSLKHYKTFSSMFLVQNSQLSRRQAEPRPTRGQPRVPVSGVMASTWNPSGRAGGLDRNPAAAAWERPVWKKFSPGSTDMAIMMPSGRHVKHFLAVGAPDGLACRLRSEICYLPIALGEPPAGMPILRLRCLNLYARTIPGSGTLSGAR